MFPFTHNMSRHLHRLAACAGLFSSLFLPTALRSQAVTAPGFAMVIHGGGGVIAMDQKGNTATPFNTPGMYRGWVMSDGRITVKIYKEQ